MLEGRYKLSRSPAFYSFFHDTLSTHTHTHTYAHSKLTLKPLRDTGKPPQCHVSVSLVFFFFFTRAYISGQQVHTFSYEPVFNASSFETTSCSVLHIYRLHGDLRGKKLAAPKLDHLVRLCFHIFSSVIPPFPCYLLPTNISSRFVVLQKKKHK